MHRRRTRLCMKDAVVLRRALYSTISVGEAVTHLMQAMRVEIPQIRQSAHNIILHRGRSGCILTAKKKQVTARTSAARSW